MRIIAKKALREFWELNPDSEEPLLAWYREAQKEDWDTPAKVKEKYRSASVIGDSRVVFNIKGNDYRLIAHVQYQASVLMIRFFGTHAEYDKIDAETV